MKKIIYPLILAFCIISCDDDSSSPSSKSNTTNNSSNTSVDFTGKFTGNYSYLEKSKSTGQTTDSSVTPNVSVTITGSSPTFTLTADADANSTLRLNTTGSTFTGSNGTGDFANNAYNGSISGTTFTLNGTGEDATSTWTDGFVGTKVSTGGGGGGGTSGNSLSVSGETVNAFVETECGNDFKGIFTGVGDIQWWLSLSFQQDCRDATPADGTYPVVDDNSLTSSNVIVILQKTDDTNLLGTYLSSTQGKSVQISTVGGNKRAVGSGITVSNVAGTVSYQVSFDITSD